jgi:hypothetical protein
MMTDRFEHYFENLKEFLAVEFDKDSENKKYIRVSRAESDFYGQ